MCVLAEGVISVMRRGIIVGDKNQSVLSMASESTLRVGVRCDVDTLYEI